MLNLYGKFRTRPKALRPKESNCSKPDIETLHMSTMLKQCSTDTDKMDGWNGTENPEIGPHKYVK